MRLTSLQGRIHGVPRVPNPTGPPAASAFSDQLHPRGAAPLAGNFLTLRNARCGSVLTTMHGSTPADQSPQKMLAGSHFYSALILINGLVVIGLHNGGPLGTGAVNRCSAGGAGREAVLIQRVQGARGTATGERQPRRYRPDPVAGCVCGDGDATGSLYLNGEA